MPFSINKYLIKYRTFDELLADVKNDMKVYSGNGMIDPSELIKIAKYVNKSLGPKIRIGDQLDQEAILYVDKGRVKLPSNFYKLKFAFGCSNYTTSITYRDGREYVPGCSVVLPNECITSCPEPVNPCVRLNECGQEIFLIERTKTECRTYTNFSKIYVTGDALTENCINKYVSSDYNAEIKGGFMYTNFPEGKIYMKYESDMEDEDGNLLVLDHDIVNPYYEYSLKVAILENAYLNGEDVAQKFKLMEERKKEARIHASTLVNTPDFHEMYMVYKLNRKAMYQKYISIFY